VVATGDSNVWIKIALAAGWISFGCIYDAAIRFLPHMEEAMYDVAGVTVIRETRASDLKRSVRKLIKICYARIRLGTSRRGQSGIDRAVCEPSRAGGEKP